MRVIQCIKSVLKLGVGLYRRERSIIVMDLTSLGTGYLQSIPFSTQNPQ